MNYGVAPVSAGVHDAREDGQHLPVYDVHRCLHGTMLVSCECSQRELICCTVDSVQVDSCWHIAGSSRTRASGGSC